jgi:predicted Rossmann fold flavoprotein
MAGVKKVKLADKKHPIVVVGGGPSGMTAAQTAVRHFDKVILFDKNPEPGKKLQSLPPRSLYISEELTPDKIAKAFGQKEDFVKPALKLFGWKELAAHLAAMGIKISSNGTSHLVVPPEIAVDISSRLKGAAEAAGVIVKKSSKVSNIVFNKDLATAVVVNSIEYPISSIIVACGSVASPGRGATADGYEFARKAGHTIVPIKPALVGLEIEEKFGKILADAEFSNCGIDVYCNGSLKFSDCGNLKFTSYGIEGDLVLTHSAKIIDLLASNKGQERKVEIHIDMIPEISKKDLEIWLNQQIEQSHKATVGTIFEKYIPLKLRNAMAKIMRIHSDKPAANLSYLERKSLLLWVKDFHVIVKRARPFNETMGVLGGVSTDEIERDSMRSGKIKNLYFAGEVLDLLGPWGGFNIQMAFSTGYLAGLSAAKAVNNE